MLQNKTVILLLVIVVSSLLADEPPTLDITKTLGNITVDGHLDDEGWVGSSSSSEFVEVMPGENIPPVVETKVNVTYDNDYLYIFFKAFDNLEDIRANVSSRDYMFKDDFVGILLDTYGDANRAYQIMVNPIGIQGDGIKIGDNEDESFDMIFESAGMIVEDGYQVEIALPFSSIRFPKKDIQNWKITFFRSMPRDDFRRQMSWTPFDRNNPCQLCQLGDLNGINGIKSKRTIEFLPSLVGTHSGELDSNVVFQNGDFNTGLALGIKIPLGETATAELAINPDFSQVEADVTQFDVNSQFALSYPERRPFFNEGSELFSSGGHEYLPNINPVYTRSINDPSLALKVLGRVGSTDYGVISAIDEETGVVVPFEDWSSLVSVGKSNVNIFRMKHALKNSSFIGGVLTDKRYANGSGTNIGTDGLFYFTQNLSLIWQLFSSITTEPGDSTLSESINGFHFGKDSLTSDFNGESFTGHQVFTRLSYNSRNNFIDLFFAEKSPTFRLDSGFLRQNNQRNLGATFTRLQYPKTDLVEKYFVTFGLGKVWNYNWKLKENWIYTSINLEMKGRLRGELAYMPTSESYLDSLYTGLSSTTLSLHKGFNDKVSVGMFGATNKSIIRYLETPEKGRSSFLNIWGHYKPTAKIKFKISLNFNSAQNFNTEDYYYKGQRIRIFSTYQFNKYLSFRLIGQYFYQEDFIYSDVSESFDLHPLLSYQPNPFTIFYIGSSHDFDEGPNGYKSFDMLHKSRQIFLKFQYLFQT